MPVLIACLLGLLAPAWAFALNLGDINLKSQPGQPVEAEIPLTVVSPEERNSLKVGLADVAGFRWAGIDWLPAHNRLQFELRRAGDGTDYIRVHSDETMQVSALRFLLKVSWSKGRLFREYTLEFGNQTGAAVSAAESARQDASAVVQESRKYQVLRHDTLWEIALELRPDTSVSIQQMMLALLRVNTDSFSYDNINWLKAGETLWIPSYFEMQTLSKTEALAETLAQNNVWREARGLATVDAGWLASANVSALDGGLRLARVEREDLQGYDASRFDAGGSYDAQALTLANEQLVELSQEKLELEDKLSEAEAIIEDLRRLVELKDDELAALQSQSLDGQAKPVPEQLERLQSLFESMVRLLRDHWEITLAGITAMLILAVWLALRRKPADNTLGQATPAASIRPDFAGMARGEPATSHHEDEIGEDDTDAEQLDTAEHAAHNKLDLARAYLELGDDENAHSILEEVLADGNAAQKEEARQLLARIESL